MFRIRRPSADFIEATKTAQRTARFTYDAVGWTREGGVPDGFAVTQWKQVIGRGEAYFELAKRALTEYRMLNLGWLQPVGCPEPIATDSLVCTLAYQGGALLAERWQDHLCPRRARPVHVRLRNPA